jgi:hypothetical protein
MARQTRTAPVATAHATGMVLPGPHDTVRVVPLFVPDEVKAPTAEAQAAAAATPPHLVYEGGPLLTNVEVFTVFWGTAWTGAQSQMAATINAFFDFILASPLIDQLGEYSVPPYTIGQGKRIGTATIAKPALHHTISDSAIQHMLQQEISTNAAFPKPGPNVLYFVYLQPGVAVVQGGGRSCQVFCGYHDAINNTIFYAVMPFANCGGCLGNMSAQDALTSTSSHELCEAITDPIPGQGWYDQNNGEIGDICAWQTKKIGAYMVQKEWSNKANTCM